MSLLCLFGLVNINMTWCQFRPTTTCKVTIGFNIWVIGSPFSPHLKIPKGGLHVVHIPKQKWLKSFEKNPKPYWIVCTHLRKLVVVYEQSALDVQVVKCVRWLDLLPFCLDDFMFISSPINYTILSRKPHKSSPNIFTATWH